MFVEAFAVLEIEMDYQFRVTVTRESRALSLKLARCRSKSYISRYTPEPESIMTVQWLGASLSGR